METRYLAAWEHRWARGRGVLGPKDVLVIDEADLMGTRQMAYLRNIASIAQGKVWLVGDSQQLQAIEAGAPLRALSNEVGHFAMVHVQRQQTPGDRAAEALARAMPRRLRSTTWLRARCWRTALTSWR